MSEPLLRVTGLVRRFGAVTALDNVDFHTDAGEVLALLGENGAGKSTAVEILSGGLSRHAGRLELAGAAYHPHDPRHARARGVAVVHQHFQLVEAFTVAENLRLAGGGLSAGSFAARWHDLEDELAIGLPRPETPVQQLGVGERQWVEIAKALATRPRLLLLDEPTAVLTPAEAERLFVAVRRYAERGTAVLFITHRLDEVRNIADRVLVLRHGRVVAGLDAGAPAQRLAEAMTGELPPQPTQPRRTPGPPVARLCGVAAPPRLLSLDLELCRSEIVVLAGVDGNGQVAAAERLAGLTTGTGTVELNGETIRNPDPRRMRRLGVSVVPADRIRQGVVPTLSVAENLALGTPEGGVHLRPRTLERAARTLIDRFAVVGHPQQLARELSGGNQQKVVVARALADRPQVLVAIHPTRGLDVAAQNAVHRHLVAAATGGAAVLLVTADLDEARTLADRILVFSRGRVVGRGGPTTPAELLARWVGGEAA